MNWIITSNSNIFKTYEAFKKLGYVDWRQKVKLKIGDIVYIYCTRPLKKVIFKTIVDKINMKFEDTVDDREFWVDKEKYIKFKKEQYCRLRLLQNVDTEKLQLNMLIQNGLKSAPQCAIRINEKLSRYIDESFKECYENFEKKVKIRSCEREVISIPASGTIDLIYKYRIHAHPNINKNYPYKKALYYTFREKNGWMKKLFSLKKIINLNPHNINEINDINLDCETKKRLCGYINDRSNSFKFSHDGEYKFYILGENLDLPKAVSLPKQNNHAYFTIKEMYSGKDVVERSNKEIIMDEECSNMQDNNFSEGKMISIRVNKYERSLKARKKCLEHYGYRCYVCEFDFEKFYGSIGKEIIEVHHKKALHQIKENYVVNPINDLIPVCSNCHTIIHSRIPIFEIEELKSIIKLKNIKNYRKYKIIQQVD
ncbi:HNH endonuclease [Clostridium senegalense]